MMRHEVSKSEFYMWRALFALAHADEDLAEGEIAHMAQIIEMTTFSHEQIAILKDDIQNPKDIEDLFVLIGDTIFEAKFFEYAREMVWADGAYSSEEKQALLSLSERHLANVNMDLLRDHVRLKLECERGYDRGNDGFEAQAGAGSIFTLARSLQSRFPEIVRH